MLAADPTKLILMFRFTSQLQPHEERLRTLWGGALCVSKGERTRAELLAIQAQVHKQSGVLSSLAGSVAGVVDVYVILDDGRCSGSSTRGGARESSASHRLCSTSTRAALDQHGESRSLGGPKLRRR